MEMNDSERARMYEVPEGSIEDMKDAYHNTQMEQLNKYTEAQFCYWTEDEFAPICMLMNLYDGTDNKEEPIKLVREHVARFNRYINEKKRLKERSRIYVQINVKECGNPGGLHRITNARPPIWY